MQLLPFRNAYLTARKSVVLATCVVATACASSPPPAVGVAASEPVEGFGQEGYSNFASQTYELRPADVISVNVFREPDLSVEQIAVGSDGNISLPLIGGIPVEGLTPVELEYEIRSKLASGYLKNPQVSVNVVEFGSHRVTVEGAVEDPGVFKFTPGARLSSAMAMAKGPTRVAKLDQVAIFRESGKQLQIAKFDYGAVRQGTMLDPVIEPGDRIVVGTSGLSQFWQDLIDTLPAFGLFATVAR